MVFETTFQAMEEAGTFELLLPFGLVFILTYAILQKVKLFGQNSGVFNFFISLILGVLIVRQGDLVEFINTYLPNISTIIIVFFGILLLMGMFGFGSGGFRGGIMILFVIISLIGGIWAFTSATQQEDFALQIPFTDTEIEIEESDAGIAILLGIFFLIVGIAGLKPKKKGIEGFIDSMSRMGDSFAGVPPRS